MKRLLIVSEPGRDGVFDAVEALIRHVWEFHPEITVDLLYSTARGSERLEKLVAEAISRRGFTADLQVGNAPQPADFAAARKILRTVASTRPDVVHAHSSKAGALVRITARVGRFPPVLYTPHAYFGLRGVGGLKEKVFSGIERLLGTTGWTQNCSADERSFGIRSLGLPGRRLILINNGVDTRRFRPASEAEKADLRAQLGLPPGGKLLAALGRASAQKNFERLYAALPPLLESGESLFAHAGAGSTALVATLPEPLREKVCCWEHLEAPENLLRAADAFVMTSRYEGLSLAMLQALTCGLPMALTDAPGLRILKRMDFRQVRWIPPEPTSDQAVTDVLASALRLPPGDPQDLAKAQSFFDQTTQNAKIVKAYGWLASRGAR